METKRCIKCGDVKDVGKFYRSKLANDGLLPCCKKCYNEYIELRKDKYKVRNFFWWLSEQDREKLIKQLNDEHIYIYNQINTESLGKSYVRRLLIKEGFPKETISEELIGLKRTMLNIKRTIKRNEEYENSPKRLEKLKRAYELIMSNEDFV